MQANTYSLEEIRKDFPVLNRRVRDDKKLVYLDNAATTQKPNQVIDAISDYYKNHNSNIHRAVHALAEESTEAFELTRDKVAEFLNIQDPQEVLIKQLACKAFFLYLTNIKYRTIKAITTHQIGLRPTRAVNRLFLFLSDSELSNGFSSSVI